MPRNIEFRYLYRDGSNYKFWGQVVFSNPEDVELNTVDILLRELFETEDLFIADQIDIPEVFPFIEKSLTASDHCYHEFHEVTDTAETPSDSLQRTVIQFLRQVKFASESGWKVFDPAERELMKSFAGIF